MKLKPVLPTLLMLAAAWLGLSALWVLFAQVERRSADEGFRHAAERLADQVLRSEREGLLRSLDDLPKAITGFGLYNDLGLPTVLLGDIGEYFELPEDLAAIPAIFENENGTFTLINTLELPGFSFDRPHRGGFAPPPPPSGWLVMHFYGPDSWRWTVWDYAGLAGPVLLALLLGSIGVLLVRNRSYQAEIAKNQELIKFSEAARTLSHELKNPVAAILLQTRLLRHTAPDSAEAAVIEEEALRISHLAERVRDFLKDADGSPVALDLAETVHDLLLRFDQPPAFTPPPGPWPVWFDPARLRSVLENLLLNARESGPNPQVALELERRKTRGQTWLTVRILDRGTGIPAELAERIFDPFFTTKDKGSGIGLPIARLFTRARGGELRLLPRPGGGTITELSLKEHT